MGLNDSIYAQFTNSELSELSSVLTRSTTRFYNEATSLFTAMSQLSIHAPEYTDMQARAAVLMAAGREHLQLAGEVHDIIWERADARAQAVIDRAHAND